MGDEELYFYLNMLKIGKKKNTNLTKNQNKKKIRLKKKRNTVSSKRGK